LIQRDTAGASIGDLSLFTLTRFALNAGLVLLQELRSVGRGEGVVKSRVGSLWKRRERERRGREIIGRRVEGLGCWVSSPWEWMRRGRGGKCGRGEYLGRYRKKVLTETNWIC
jgi:hypothetical protein